MILRTLAKLSLGALIGGIVGNIVTGDDTYAVLWALAIPAFIFLSLISGLRGRARPDATTYALARVETIQRTGVEVDGAQLCDARLVVVPERGSPYSTSAQLPIATEDLRLYAAGTVFVVARTRDGKDVSVVPTPTEAWADRVTAAKADPSLIPSSTMVREWTPVERAPSRRRRRPWEAVVSILIIAVGAALALIPAYGQLARTAQSWAAGDFDGTNLLTGRFQQDAVDAIAAVAGSYQFTNMTFSREYIFVDGLTSPTASTIDSYVYRYGTATRSGPASIQPQDVNAELFDASLIDFSRVAASVDDAIARSGLTQIDSTYANVSRGGEALQITVTLSAPYESLTFIYDVDGTLISKP